MATRPQQSGPLLRLMRESDLAPVAQMEAETFPDPWPLNSFRECLLFGYCCLVLEEEGVVQGYAVMAAEVESAHILNLCVGRPFRRKGRGRQLLNYLLEKARAAQLESVFLEVRPSNREAINLYRSAGFVEMAVRKGYYPMPQGREDALILVLSPLTGGPRLGKGHR